MGIKHIPTKTTYLEMLTRPTEPLPKPGTTTPRLRRRIAPTVKEYRDLYNAVGAAYRWVDRNFMPDCELQDILQDDRVEVYLLEVDGRPAGFAELDRRIANQVELAYFGLFPSYIGQGLGHVFLRRVIEQAWTKSTRRVWVHTCDLDHPAALPTYLKAGFLIYDERTILQVVPDCP